MPRTSKAQIGGKSSPGKKRPDSGGKPDAVERASARPAPSDALTLLKADHRAVRQLFKAFEAATGDAAKRQLANDICVALKVHARLEEDLFYPAAAAAVDDLSLIDEAQVEHASARDLIAQIESGAPGEALFDARVKVLREYIDHHVAEEENEIFPQCRAAGLDLAELGRLLALRRHELMVGFRVSNPILALT